MKREMKFKELKGVKGELSWLSATKELKDITFTYSHSQIHLSLNSL